MNSLTNIHTNIKKVKDKNVEEDMLERIEEYETVTWFGYCTYQHIALMHNWSTFGSLQPSVWTTVKAYFKTIEDFVHLSSIPSSEYWNSK